MRHIAYFHKLFLTVFICALLAGPASAAMSDKDFFRLCQKGSLQEIVEAIEGGADVNARTQDHDWATPLMWALENPDPEVITVLVKAGADVNVQDGYGVTPLIRAMRYDPNPEVIAALINAGAEDVLIKPGGKETSVGHGVDTWRFRSFAEDMCRATSLLI